MSLDWMEKNIIYVTDNGFNIVKACKLAGVEQLGCIAHGVHNLITVDGISKTESVKKIVRDAKDIVHIFVYVIDDGGGRTQNGSRRAYVTHSERRC